MKVQIIFVPPFKSTRYGDLGENLTPPLGILYLGAYLKDRIQSVDLELTDGLKIGYEATLKKIKEFKPDIIGLSFYTPVALSAYRLADDIRALLPDSLIVSGGPHSTSLPEEVLERSSVDIVAIGEGEETFFEIVKASNSERQLSKTLLKTIDGLAYKDDDLVIRTKKRAFIKDLDTIPFPARGMVEMDTYKGWYVHKKLPETKMFFSRGCPYSCTFCDSAIWKSSKPSVRLRSPKNIVDELEHISKAHGIKEIMDDSDEFNNSEKHALAICEEMKNRGLDIPWKTQLRAWPLSEELVSSMAEAGCWYVHLGIESGNEETLKGIKKHITLKQVKDACRLLKKYDIQILGLFMLFNVWEEEGELKYEDVEMTKKTFSFIEEMVDEGLLDYIGWSVTTPYPGSQLYEIAVRHNLIKPELRGKWDSWLRDDVYIMNLPGVDEKEMVRMKTNGQLLRAKLILRSRKFGIKDVPFFAQKGLKMLRDEARNIIRR